MAKGTEPNTTGDEPTTPASNGTGNGFTGENREPENDTGNSDNSGGNSTDTGSGSFEFVNDDEQPTKKRRGRPPKDPNAQGSTTRTKSSTKSKVKDGQKAADYLLSWIERSTTKILDKDTSFNSDELFLIKDPLATILEQMDITAVEKYSKIINPILVLFGLMLWYIRIAPKPTIVRKANVQQNSNGFKEPASATSDERPLTVENPFFFTQPTEATPV